MKRIEWFRDRAKESYHEEGKIEIDDDAHVSTNGGHGAYVQAWVWVPFETTRRTPDIQRHGKKRNSVRSRTMNGPAQET
jgi:hypothetical protein